jgi:hypothetical protein
LFEYSCEMEATQKRNLFLLICVVGFVGLIERQSGFGLLGRGAVGYHPTHKTCFVVVSR